MNQFGFVQTVDGLSQGVVVTVAFAGNYASYCRCVSQQYAYLEWKKKGDGTTVARGGRGVSELEAEVAHKRTE